MSHTITPHSARRTALGLVLPAVLALGTANLPAYGTEAPQLKQGPVGQSSVSGEEGLVSAIEEATKTITNAPAGTYTSWVITESSCLRQSLPDTISFPVPLTVVGCDTTAVGPGVGKTPKKTPITTNRGTRIQSPFTLTGVDLNVRNHVLSVSSSMAITKSYIQASGTPHATIPDVIMQGAFSAAEHDTSPTITIEDNRVHNATLLAGTYHQAEVFIFHNTISTKDYVGPVIDIPAVAGEPKKVTIQRNTFTQHAHRPQMADIRVGRGQVLIADNTFSSTSGAINRDGTAREHDGLAIALHGAILPTGGSTYRVHISGNRFITGGIAIANSTGHPLPTGFVRLIRNHFEQAAAVLPVRYNDPQFNSISPKAAVDARYTNMWGALDLNNVNALTDPGNLPDPSFDPGPAPLPDDSTDGPVVPVERIMGETRFETAIKVSQRDFPHGNKTVILARHDIPADAIAAIPYAKAFNAPILLTQTEEIHPGTLEEIQRLVAPVLKSHVILMGGEAAISANTERTLGDLVDEVHRIGGANRFETAVAIAEAIGTLATPAQILLTDGEDWQPALIAGPAAAEAQGVIVTTAGSRIPEETQAFLNANSSVPVVTVGAKAAATGVGETALEAADPTTLSVQVARQFFPEAPRVGIATTKDFPDALTGGAHIARSGGPIMLVNAGSASEVRTWVTGAPSVQSGFVYGGPVAMPDDLVNRIYGQSLPVGR